MNTIKKYTSRSLWLAGLMITTLMTGCLGGGGSSNAPDTSETTAAPFVVETVPANAATDVAPNSRKVIAAFSEAMDVASINATSFTIVDQYGVKIDGAVDYIAASKSASFTAGEDFAPTTGFTATLTTMVKNASGTPMAENNVWTFTTGATDDVTDPYVISTYPLEGATGFPLNYNVSAKFSEALDPASVNNTSFTLSQNGTNVSGEVSYRNEVATFTPSNNLLANNPYIATLTTAIKDLAGNALVAKTWSFTTGDSVANGPAAVDLKTAENFAIMTGTGITSADGSASITGNIGTSGITGASITVACTELAAGFQVFTDEAAYPGAVCTSTDKDAASLALADVLTAYTAASAPNTPAGVGPFLELGSGTVITQTLVPGVYTWAGNVTITGDITLEGGADAVWIFQIDGTLDTNKAIILSGGALAKNVFWRVADAVSLNTGAKFKGVVLAKTKVDMITSTTIEGRLLAQTAVALGTTTVVTQPAP